MSHLKPVDGKPLTFALNGVSLPQYEGMQLVPFYQLYECRYQIYFPLYSQSEWTTKQQKITQAEQARMLLEEQTVDKVFCGEQQSESDHFFQSDRSWNGSDGGIHWRRTRGTFSYQLRRAEAKHLMIQSFAGERGQIRLSANGTDIGTFTPNSQGSIIANLPEMSGETFKLEFSAVNGQETPRISEVRALKE